MVAGKWLDVLPQAGFSGIPYPVNGYDLSSSIPPVVMKNAAFSSDGPLYDFRGFVGRHNRKNVTLSL